MKKLSKKLRKEATLVSEEYSIGEAELLEILGLEESIEFASFEVYHDARRIHFVFTRYDK